MDDDLYDLVAKAAADAVGRQAFSIGREVGREEGRQEGRIEGQAVGEYIGFVAGVNSVKAALSDGTRHGSPLCSKALESLKRLGAIDDKE